MKILLNVKTGSNLTKPSKNDVLVYDGSEWYVTTREDLLCDAQKMLNDCEVELSEIKIKSNVLEDQFAAFKKDVAAQLYEMSELIKKLYSK